MIGYFILLHRFPEQFKRMVASAGRWYDFVNLIGAVLLRGARISGFSRANGEFAVLDLKIKPTSVAGPLGPVTMDDLPSSSTTYWTARRKAEVLAAIDGGLMDFEDACERYRLSREELAGWRRMLDRAGVPGLRITNRQRLRDQYIFE